jgi:hypothetical protein
LDRGSSLRRGCRRCIIGLFGLIRRWIETTATDGQQDGNQQTLHGVTSL